MEEMKTQSNSHIPLVTRLDHLDFVMKSLEGKQDLSKWGAKTNDQERQPFSLDLAAREAYFKGSLMDRVAILERRLFQLCLETESCNRSSGAGSSSSQVGCSDGSKSSVIPNHVLHFQDFSAPNRIPQVNKEKTNKEEGKKDSKAREQKTGKNSKPNGGDEKPPKNATKKTSPKWPHIKMLGC